MTLAVVLARNAAVVFGGDLSGALQRIQDMRGR